MFLLLLRLARSDHFGDCVNEGRREFKGLENARESIRIHTKHGDETRESVSTLFHLLKKLTRFNLVPMYTDSYCNSAFCCKSMELNDYYYKERVHVLESKRAHQA